jgi:hypothetical protein
MTRKRRRQSTHYLDFIKIEGIIRIRELPIDCTEEDFKAWWPRLAEQEKDRYTVDRFHNLITAGGKTALINYLKTLPATVGTQLNNVDPFGEKMALGNGVVTGIFASDTSIFGLLSNKNITSASGNSNQVDYSTFFASTDISSSITLTNGGLFGGSGANVLLTHFACSYTTTANPFTFDYLINLS